MVFGILQLALPIRYKVGSPDVPALIFKVYIGSLFTTFWFGNLVTTLRFLQVCVWKRVMEINEDLLSKATTLSVLLVCGMQGCLCNPEYKLYAAISGQF